MAVRINFGVVVLAILCSSVRVSTAADCGTSDVVADFTPCIGSEFVSTADVTLKRDLFFHYSRSCNDSASAPSLPRPTLDIPCDLLTCASGMYLAYDSEIIPPSSTGKKSARDFGVKCADCPRGTFSTGGGAFVSRWKNPLPAAFRSTCYGYDSGVYRTDHNCNKWIPSDDGTHMWSGNNTEFNMMFSVLQMTVDLVRDGYIRFRFKVDAEENFDGLKFLINDELSSVGFVSTQLDWREVNLTLPRGSHSLKWEYGKDFYLGRGLDYASLQMVEVSGTDWADTSCQPCENALGPGCTLCGKDMYHAASTNQCKHCPDGTYAFEGSSGVESCRTRPKCTESDYFRVFTECGTNGKRMARYKWAEPKVCSEDLEGAAKLPNNGEEVEVDCAPCDPGMVRNAETGKCEFCPFGTVGAAGATACSPCEDGSFAPKQLHYTSFPGLPERFSTSCSTNSAAGVCPKETRWRAEEKYLTTGLTHERDADLVLSYEVEVGQEGGLISFVFSLIGQPEIEEDVGATKLLFYVDSVTEASFVGRNVPAGSIPSSDSNSGSGASNSTASNDTKPIHGAGRSRGSDGDGTINNNNNDNVNSNVFVRSSPARQHVVKPREAMVPKYDHEVSTHQLAPGKHTIQWIYRRKFSATHGVTKDTDRALIHDVVITGSTIGGASECVPCPRGTKSVKTPANRFVSSAATADDGYTCVPCSPGSIAAKEGSSTCELCEAGTMAPGEGAFECRACGKGTSSIRGSKECSADASHIELNSESGDNNNNNNGTSSITMRTFDLSALATKSKSPTEKGVLFGPIDIPSSNSIEDEKLFFGVIGKGVAKFKVGSNYIPPSNPAAASAAGIALDSDGFAVTKSESYAFRVRAKTIAASSSTVGQQCAPTVDYDIIDGGSYMSISGILFQEASAVVDADSDDADADANAVNANGNVQHAREVFDIASRVMSQRHGGRAVSLYGVSSSASLDGPTALNRINVAADSGSDSDAASSDSPGDGASGDGTSGDSEIVRRPIPSIALSYTDGSRCDQKGTATTTGKPRFISTAVVLTCNEVEAELEASTKNHTSKETTAALAANPGELIYADNCTSIVEVITVHACAKCIPDDYEVFLGCGSIKAVKAVPCINDVSSSGVDAKAEAISKALSDAGYSSVDDIPCPSKTVTELEAARSKVTQLIVLLSILVLLLVLIGVVLFRLRRRHTRTQRELKKYMDQYGDSLLNEQGEANVDTESEDESDDAVGGMPSLRGQV